MAELFIRRARAYADALRAYKVFVDGEPRGAVRQGDELKLEVAPGPHTVQMRIDWCSSPELFVRAGDEPVRLTCRSRGGWHAFFAFITPANYIRLEHADG